MVYTCLFAGFRGNGASVIRIIPYAALHFMTYERYKCWILENCPTLGSGPVIDLLAGSAAGGTSALCTYPLDLARTKLAYQVGISAKHFGKYLNMSPLLQIYIQFHILKPYISLFLQMKKKEREN